MQQESGDFEPELLRDEYASAVRELVQAKIEQCAPAIEIGRETSKTPAVIDIMAALKESVQAKGRTKVQDAIRNEWGRLLQSRRSLSGLHLEQATDARPTELPGLNR